MSGCAEFRTSVASRLASLLSGHQLATFGQDGEAEVRPIFGRDIAFGFLMSLMPVNVNNEDRLKLKLYWVPT